jgi:hypothetical protein
VVLQAAIVDARSKAARSRGVIKIWAPSDAGQFGLSERIRRQHCITTVRHIILLLPQDTRIDLPVNSPRTSYST